jgi:ABC-type transporter Mla MlaB component
MPTNITQIEDAENGRTILRVEGEMLRDDALLIERIGVAIQSEMGHSVAIDLADLDLLDSESASVLKRLETEHGFELIGMEIFLQTVVNEAEKH